MRSRSSTQGGFGLLGIVATLALASCGDAGEKPAGGLMGMLTSSTASAPAAGATANDVDRAALLRSIAPLVGSWRATASSSLTYTGIGRWRDDDPALLSARLRIAQGRLEMAIARPSEESGSGLACRNPRLRAPNAAESADFAEMLEPAIRDIALRGPLVLACEADRGDRGTTWVFPLGSDHLVMSVGGDATILFARDDAPPIPVQAERVDRIAQLEMGQAGSCASEIGQEVAQRLADQCRFVSPATRPPCHPANPCEMIRSETARGCAMLPVAERPAFCTSNLHFAIIGAWAPVQNGCDSGEGFILNHDGAYSTFGENGRWALSEAGLTFVATSTNYDGYAERQLSSPERTTVRIASLNATHMTFQYPDGAKMQFERCER